MEQTQFPLHVAIIPDGNRRWAREQGRSRFEGRLEGAKRFREISRTAFEMGVRCFTFWGASIDNLKKRSSEEVKFLAGLLKEELGNGYFLRECLKNKIRFRMLGTWNEILKDEILSRTVANIECETCYFNGRRLTLLFGYSGEQEMTEAVRDMCESVNNGLDPSRINAMLIKNFLWTGSLPPVDLVVRTGACEEGPNWSHYSSGFMMWLAANAKTYSSPTLWPDFTVEMFRQTIADYSKTSRRSGA
ncbi:MAG: polyprenyl diphosphate synthase [bacterium]|nr:polyprenyl diphosphate synthase [bacterium]